MEQQFAIYITRDFDDGTLSLHIERPELCAGCWASGTTPSDLPSAIISQFGDKATCKKPARLIVTVREAQQ